MGDALVRDVGPVPRRYVLVETKSYLSWVDAAAVHLCANAPTAHCPAMPCAAHLAEARRRGAEMAPAQELVAGGPIELAGEGGSERPSPGEEGPPWG